MTCLAIRVRLARSVTHTTGTVVCTENVVRIDLVTESHNHPGRWSRCYPFFSIPRPRWAPEAEVSGRLPAVVAHRFALFAGPVSAPVIVPRSPS